jgi:hypothetical protein
MDFEGFEILIEGLGDGEKNTAEELRNLFTHLLGNIFLPGDIKIVHCTQEELETDYTSTGLGIGKRSGWAQCNGLNGTPPYGGRVPMGMSDEYPTIGATGGSKDAVVVEHEHDTNGFGPVNSGTNGLADNAFFYGLVSKTSKVGVPGTDKNLQPYLVQLILMKLYPAT